ncbi:hypothetical protein HPB51_014019 [Rhipicephalus microplus]|uniref:Uncharacterized protein n=1 Tax=Rhipicephalus microplus TaxID=6941 RepID=A0A9J6DAK5_RHIMP|nr:hypothetical protein HPB51_014019 [Rhipicephalus microplus]
MTACLRVVATRVNGGRRRSEFPLTGSSRHSTVRQAACFDARRRLYVAAARRQSYAQPPSAPESRGHALTAAVDMVTSISRCISSATVEIIEGGGSCPSRSPSGCIVSEPSKPPSPSVYIVSESTRPPLPMVCVVKVWSPSFCVTSSKRTASPAAVHVVTEGQAAAAAESHPFITRCHIVVA